MCLQLVFKCHTIDFSYRSHAYKNILKTQHLCEFKEVTEYIHKRMEARNQVP